jgi:hypothetical protein
MLLGVLLAQVIELRKRTESLPDDYWVVLVGDMITEEALPTYMAMLNTLDGVRDETGEQAISSFCLSHMPSADAPPLRAMSIMLAMVNMTEKKGMAGSLQGLKVRRRVTQCGLMVLRVARVLCFSPFNALRSWMHGMPSLNLVSCCCRWTRAWTAEENRHGDLMNKYCYLSGKVNMKVR